MAKEIKEKDTSNSLYRQWQMLSYLPNGKWLGTREMQQQLKRDGVDISLRTVQRDLNQLALRFPIESNNEVPQGWRWKHDAPIRSLPNMNSSQAMTFMMAEEHLRHLMPPTLLNEMRPWFDLARQSLSSQRSHVRQWVNRVRIVSAMQPMIPPHIDAETQRIIYEGLLQDQQLKCIYRARTHQGEEKKYVLNPLALVQRGAVIYLICTRKDKNRIQQFALHRFIQAELLETRSMHPVSFDIDQYIEEGALGFRIHPDQKTETIAIELILLPEKAYTLYESKLTEDQQIEEIEIDQQKYVQVRANVPLNLQLVWWLRSFGSALIDVKPKQLKAEVFAQDSAHYSKDKS